MVDAAARSVDATCCWIPGNLSPPLSAASGHGSKMLMFPSAPARILDPPRSLPTTSEAPGTAKSHSPGLGYVKDVQLIARYGKFLAKAT